MKLRRAFFIVIAIVFALSIFFDRDKKNPSLIEFEYIEVLSYAFKCHGGIKRKIITDQKKLNFIKSEFEKAKLLDTIVSLNRSTGEIRIYNQNEVSMFRIALTKDHGDVIFLVNSQTGYYYNKKLTDYIREVLMISNTKTCK